MCRALVLMLFISIPAHGVKGTGKTLVFSKEIPHPLTVCESTQAEFIRLRDTTTQNTLCNVDQHTYNLFIRASQSLERNFNSKIEEAFPANGSDNTTIIEGITKDVHTLRRYAAAAQVLAQRRNPDITDYDKEIQRLNATACLLQNVTHILAYLRSHHMQHLAQNTQWHTPAHVTKYSDIVYHELATLKHDIENKLPIYTNTYQTPAIDKLEKLIARVNSAMRNRKYQDTYNTAADRIRQIRLLFGLSSNDYVAHVHHASPCSWNHKLDAHDKSQKHGILQQSHPHDLPTLPKLYFPDISEQHDTSDTCNHQ